MFNYQPEDIFSFHCYIYEWMDELNFCMNPSGFSEDYEQYAHAAKMKFLSHKWTGDGMIQLLWIPPFALLGILEEGVDSFMERFGEFWSRGLILWHVKQTEDGLSFLLSPVKLNIPDYGLEM